MARISNVFALIALLAPTVAVSLDVPQIPQIPKIQVSTRLVEIDVIVRDKDGPVANLTKEDFAVFDRGKPQEISVFAMNSTPSATMVQMLPQNTFSDLPQYNTDPPRSVTVVLLDNLNTLYGSAPAPKESTPNWIEDLALQRAKTHLIRFLEQLGPQDRVAIYGLSDSLHVLCDFTSDRSQLLAIVKRYDATAKTSREVVEPGAMHPPVLEHAADPFENEAAGEVAGMADERRAGPTMAALTSIAAHLANIPGRKNLVWLTADLPFSGAEMAHVLRPANIAVYPVDARGLLARAPATQLMEGTESADAVSGAGGYVAPAQTSVPPGIASMQKLADETGGEAFVNTNDITGAIHKAVEDSAVTYRLGFYIGPASIDGKLHELKVQVKRKGVVARYPKDYFAFEDKSATRGQDRDNLAAAVVSPLESSTIPLQVKVDRVDQPLPNSFAVSGSIDIHNLRITQNGGMHKGAVELAIVEQDETGKMLAQSGKNINFQLTEQQYVTCLKSGLLFHQYAQSRTGVTSLRILVEDPNTAQVGSLIIPLSQVK